MLHSMILVLRSYDPSAVALVVHGVVMALFLELP